MDRALHASAIHWKIHLASPPQVVYHLLSTDEGRARFWAEAAQETEGEIAWTFPNGARGRTKILEQMPPYRYVVEYWGESQTTFELQDDGMGGTDLTLLDQGVSEKDRLETTAGWVSVLLALKAAADFGVDLRNHDPQRTWDQGFADN